MKISKKSITVPMLAAAMLFGCTNDNVAPGNEVNPVEIPASVSNGTTSFAFDFIHALQKTQSAEENLFVSPLSLHMALGMLLNGAEKETADEIQKALKMDAVALADLNAAYKTLINDLPVADSKVSLGLANSVWYRNDFSVENDFQSVLKNSFESEVTGLPFDDAAKDRINKWASDKTNGKIPTVLDQIQPQQVMFLLNALYFKGDWQTRFDAGKTQDTPFRLENGQSKNVKMMFAESDFKVGSGSNYDAVRLPYANGQFNMTLLIPKGQHTVDAVLNDITGEGWTKLNSGMAERGITVGLPRFTFKYSAKLNGTLDAMGIKRAFVEGNAQLNKINKVAQLYVDFVKQDAYLGIDEKGTEAAAVTTIGVGLTSAGPESPRFICDRPFGLIISESTSNTILFMGRIKNPESK
ncbi:serpin B [Dyadobacter sp. BE34]|uniref:Serpin B n=1 Tax=Dyadobacter fermentans TaxID=94254 RepID=A0ABU1R4M6_9BACT|nr:MULTISPECIES: serpin family protein [Dyadobacter]MDR6807849.1 serpin B [Dyadobacter fermentans]MDR7045590.1 serpin B [Dyadobacter sp. BE242]MDR7199903.1 serpin B [Dyadobacter sp. BE34]MDR7217638.1 serpin B [Dyadobacter sp. BE31]MDR7265794.1 serpin B [Dyadobacter sp. BE32]